MNGASVISLFTGIGGLDLGLEESGFEVKLCVEIDRERCDFLVANRPSWRIVNGDVRRFAGTQLKRLAEITDGESFILSGGSPCQGFSKAAFWLPHRFAPGYNDPRKTLIFEFARITRELQPAAFIFENVPSLTYQPNKYFFDMFLSQLKKAHYTISWKIVNAAEYGVPQRRERLFVVGSKRRIPFAFPPATHAAVSRKARKGLKKPVSSGEAIGDLDDGKIAPDEVLSGKWGHLLYEIPPGQNYLFLTKERNYPRPLFKWRSRYWSFLAKLDPSEPSWTIPAHPSHYSGPFHWNNRRLRIPEVRRLQTFPDYWKLPSSRDRAWSMLGDAVPPMLSRIIGKSIFEQLLQ